MSLRLIQRRIERLEGARSPRPLRMAWHDSGKPLEERRAELEALDPGAEWLIVSWQDAAAEAG